MATRRYSDPLSMDVSDDLERVDGVMTRILSDRAVWNEFLTDPNGVFVRLGLHPATTPEINDRVNRIFYATLTNTKLLKLLLEHYEKFRPRKMAQYRDHFVSGLKRGLIDNDIELDREGIEHLLQAPAMLAKILRLTLDDLNEKRLLTRYYSRKDINKYIDGVVAAVKARQPLSAHPKLEVWDRNYGIGKAFGGLLAEAGVLVTVAGVVEASALVTAAVVAVAHTEVTVLVDGGTIVTILASAAAGDKESIRATAVLGRLLDLSGELLLHAHHFEKGSPS